MWLSGLPPCQRSVINLRNSIEVFPFEFLFTRKAFIPWVWSQVRGFGHGVSFKGNENNSIIQPQLKPNGVKLRLMVQSQRFISKNKNKNMFYLVIDFK